MKIVVSITVATTIFLTFLFSTTPEAAPPLSKTGTADSSNKGEEQHNPVNPNLQAPKLISIQTEFIELPTNTLTRLLLDDKNTTSNASPLRMKAQELLDKGEARMLDTQLVVAKNGDKVISESFEEFTYPSEYEPPEIPGKVQNLSDIPHQHTAQFFSVFEARKLGSFIEVEPRFGDSNNEVSVRLLPRYIWRSGETTWLESKDESGNYSKISWPNFCQIWVDTSIRCIHGQHTLVSVHSPTDTQGKLDSTKKVMVFVKCKILSVIE